MADTKATEGTESANLHSLRHEHPDINTAAASTTATPLHPEKSVASAHISKSLFASRHPAHHDPTLLDAQMEDHLTFFQRHFTKPMDKDPEKFYKSSNRPFSFLSVGFLFTAACMLVVLLGVVAAAVAVTLNRRHPRGPVSSGEGSGSGSGPSGGAGPNSTTQISPIRAAISENFPDPTVWLDNGTWYAFATNDAAGILQQPQNSTAANYGLANVQLAISTDFVTWDLQNVSTDPLPNVGQWVPQGLTQSTPHIPRGNVWAPGMIQRPTDNKFVLYYSALRVDASVPVANHPPPHCIGAAVSDGWSPAGPYTPLADALECPTDQGGAIDPAGFRDTDSTLYMLYKVDGNNMGHGGLCGNTVKPIVPTPIMLQRLENDGVTKIGNATQVLSLIPSDDGPLIEAPNLVKSPQGIYFLFFSSGCTRSPTYDIKYATSKSVHGPYQRAGSPLLQTGDWGLVAPGSVGIHADGNGGFNMAFHARVSLPEGKVRAMFTTKLEFNGHVATMARDNSTAS